MATKDRKVKLVSMDGEAFEVEAKVAAMSKLVQTLVDDEQEGEEVQETPLPNVKSHVLAKVVEFCQHHKDTPMAEIQKPLKSNVLSESVDGWDAKLLLELLLLAEHLQVRRSGCHDLRQIGRFTALELALLFLLMTLELHSLLLLLSSLLLLTLLLLTLLFKFQPLLFQPLLLLALLFLF
ncbi:hypothetical protein PPTG_20169 [Phytophthora nicotianae INRA-310]|uniref:SKP1 component POZ domain-containing protein n=1 Tax=Phytophthora nicotianae (strain INRA-310) TaxID=761204 RepID=W2PBS3_PHYN3|nr:hypothetical protein PPTG_20169 [Phytophthora nicotianae INRA-310]ETM97444.1 hypothetical protein PPTG_20169 [Phytophthora nicotianae INRA-310]